MLYSTKHKCHYSLKGKHIWLNLRVVKKEFGIFIFYWKESENWLTDESRNKAIYMLFKVIKVCYLKTKN